MPRTRPKPLIFSRKQEKNWWGDLIIGFIRCLWHNNIGAQLEEILDAARAFSAEEEKGPPF